MLNIEHLTKTYGGKAAVQDLSLHIRPGEICAFIGHNGAGKTTTLKCCCGIQQFDSGRITVDGISVQDDPLECKQRLAYLPDNPDLYEYMTGIQYLNFIADIFAVGARERAERIRSYGDQFDLTRDLAQPISAYSHGMKQKLAIISALVHAPKLIIMDEPTTSLTEPEIRRVFDMMNTLRKSGVGIVFISHKLREVMEICTRYTVLRDGNMVSSGLVSETSVDMLARDMVGHDVRTQSLRREKKIGNVILSGKGMTLEPHFRNVSFEVHAGEVLGFTGLLGDGRSELFQTVFGAIHGASGTVEVEGKPVHIRTTGQALKAGVGYVPRNRKENGIIKDMSILENGTVVTWPRDSKMGFLHSKKIEKDFDDFEKELHIKLGSAKDLIGSLSGGNQQKVVLAKWLDANPKVLVFDNPTQGVDVGAKEEIYDIILKLAEAGVAVIVLSSEAQEIIRVCDRTVVMFHGSVQGELVGDEMNEQAIMRLATGGQV